MISREDIDQIVSRGSSVETVAEQVERFRKGFPWMKIKAPATPEKGICVMDAEAVEEAASYMDKTEVDGITKFVPASGAASRMFKDLFAGMEAAAAGEYPAEGTPADRFVAGIRNFAFYDSETFPTDDALDILERTLTDKGLGYGNKPKGVLKFHRYADGQVRTAFAEHLVEAQEYMRNPDGSADLMVTISPEHRQLFEQALAEVKDTYEQKYGIKYNVRFTYQDKATDTVAVDPGDKPFRDGNGRLLFRPAGHGALIHNLNKVESELVSIKNIDNVANERLLPVTAKYKKALMGKALQLRDAIFGYLMELDAATGDKISTGIEFMPVIPGYNNTLGDRYATAEVQELCNDIEEFLDNELCITLPPSGTCRERVEAIRKVLNRPVRVCGMVRNQGEPGGGPFIIEEKDGSTSLQILESVQIDKNNPQAVAALRAATHFNPVDIVCCLKDYQGNRFDLTEFVDEDAGFISSKSYKGRELKALELPGLWNGAMSRWNTLFVEVPLETFNPVKTVLDLLRPAHQD